MEKGNDPHHLENLSDDSDSEYDEMKEEEEEDDDNLLKEMIAIAKSEDHIGSLTEVEVIFLPIKSLENVKLCHNLIQLTLIKTGTNTIEGIESWGHSLESLTMIDCGLEIIENSFAYLTNLRELNLAENNIPSIQNLDNCLHLEKLFLYSNKISTMNGLNNNKKLKELYLQDNIINKVSSCSKLSNLQVLLLSGNRIKNLNDLQDIENLPQLKKLSFACESFAPCPVAEISGYRQYVLSVCAKSPYLQVLDSEYLTEDDLNYAKNEFIESVLELQKSLEEVEKSHRHSVLTIDSKLRENEQHLEDIEDTLVDELNNLRTDIEDGKNKLLNEFEKLKKLRYKSEESFLKSLKELEEKYEGVFNQVINTEEEKFKDWEVCGQKAVKSLEFEKEVYLMLVDALYSTKGKVIYSDIISTSAEFSYLSNLINRRTSKELKCVLKKAFHVNFSDIDFNESLQAPRVYVKLSVSQIKDFLHNRKLPEYDPEIVDESFPGNINLSEGDWVLVTLKSDKKISTKENPVITYWKKGEFDKIYIEFALVLTCMTLNDALVYQDMNEDERLVDVISECHNLPAESLAMIKNLEREIFEKFADHERRVWGELEPSALSKYKMQQDELTKLHGSLQTLKSKIEEERNTQEKILRDMREALVGPGGSKLY